MGRLVPWWSIKGSLMSSVQQGCHNHSSHSSTPRITQYLLLQHHVAEGLPVTGKATSSSSWDSAKGLPLPPFRLALSPWQHAPHAAHKPQTQTDSSSVQTGNLREGFSKRSGHRPSTSQDFRGTHRNLRNIAGLPETSITTKSRGCSKSIIGSPQEKKNTTQENEPILTLQCN